MNLELELPPDIEDRLHAEASRTGDAVDRVAIQLLDRSLPDPDKSDRALNLIAKWMKEDESLSDEEILRHRAVLRAIDDDRPSERKLFEKILEEWIP